MYTIFVDSDCDMTPELCSKYGFKLISMPYSIDGKEVFPYVDFKEFDYKKFYNQLRAGVLPTTSALSPEQYKEYFEPEFEKGNDILYIHFSAAMSGTFNALHLALEELKEKYPDRKFERIDTKGITLGSYNICCTIGDLLQSGKTVEEVLAMKDDIVDHTAFYFYADDLKFFGKSGRVSGFAAFFGNIIGIKPILISDAHGHNIALKKVRGRQAALQEIADSVIRTAIDPEHNYLAITHADCPEDAQKIADMIAEKIHFKEVFISHLGPILGASCGPETVMAMHYGEEVTVVGE